MRIACTPQRRQTRWESRTRTAVLVLLFAVPGNVLAHDAAGPHAGGGAFSPWDLVALGFLVGVGVLYFLGSVRLAQRRAVHRRSERVAFAAGWLALVGAILPPLDSLAVSLFSVHMAQHELMMLVGAPLLIAGRPLPVCMAGMSAGARRSVGALLQAGATAATWRALTTPVVAWALHGAAVWIWHLPALYEAAAASEAIHAFQHATFVGTAALFWWGMLYGRYGRAGYGAAVFYVFTTTVHTGLLGAILTLATSSFYPGYAVTAAARGVDPIEDQQLAGLIMWVPAGIVLTVAGVALFAAWIGAADRRAGRTGRAAS
jgi:putative membrane protein